MPVDLTGRTLLHYRITARLGEGGMGEVWRATDTELDREVAIKVLPAAFVEEAERLSRFEREAKLLAQLNHPNIAQIHGLAASGVTRALVMELVEGPTLAERLAGGALSLEESLDIALQIAAALEEAHEKGIVHRDLKPQNVKVTEEGTVKVLDFGLAKAMDLRGGATGAQSASQLAASPTLTLGATVEGVILGTAGYMAPEQARGLAVDKRADIWAFGVLLFEMLTGRRLFAGDSVPETLAGVLKGEIDLAALPPDVPPAIHRLLRRCLERQPRERLRDIGDARLVIADVLAGRAEAGAARPRRGRTWLIAAAGLLTGALVSLGALGMLGGRDATAPAPAPVRATIEIPDPFLVAADDRALALSPDGRELVVALLDPTEQTVRLHLRALDELALRPLPGSEGATYPFWSPDGRSIAFFAGGKLKRIDLPHGIVRTLCDAPQGRGGTWSPSGAIVFAPSATGPLSRVSVEGGTPVELTKLVRDGEMHRLPRFLPDGRTILFWAGNRGAPGEEAIYAFDPERGETKKILDSGTEALYVEPGYLAYVSEGNLLLQPFDARRLALSGSPRPIASGVHSDRTRWYANLDLAPGGQLVYQQAIRAPGFTLLWLDAAGEETPAWSEALPSFFVAGSVSPDGRRAAVNSRDVDGVWRLEVLDFGRGTRTPIGVSGRFLGAAWAPDGEVLATSVFLGGEFQLATVAPRAGETPRPLTSGVAREQWPGSFTPDGRAILFSQYSNVDKRGDLLLVDVDGATGPRPFLGGPSNEAFPRLSPAGRWVLYGADASGRWEGWVTDFPTASGRWQVTVGAGDFGWSWLWLGEDEIGWLNPSGRLVAATIRRVGNDVEIGAWRELLGGRTLDTETEVLVDYSLARQRLLLARSAPYEPPDLVVVNDWRAGR